MLDLGSGNSACFAAMCAVRAGASRVLSYDDMRVRCEVLKEVLAANGMSRKVAVIRSNIVDQERASPQQEERPADTLLVDITVRPILSLPLSLSAAPWLLRCPPAPSPPSAHKGLIPRGVCRTLV